MWDKLIEVVGPLNPAAVLFAVLAALAFWHQSRQQKLHVASLEKRFDDQTESLERRFDEEGKRIDATHALVVGQFQQLIAELRRERDALRKERNSLRRELNRPVDEDEE